MKRWTHWATSADLWSLRLPAHDAGTGLGGRALGRLHRGGSFVFDPFDAYDAGLVTNPNMVIAGAIGMGKSTLVKMMLDRALDRGRRVVVVDPKGEYDALARAYGVTPLLLGLDGWCNPFGRGALEDGVMVRTLLESAQTTPLTAEQHYALDRAWARGAAEADRPLRALYDTVAGVLARDGSSPERDIALLVRRFIDGDFAGLFDGDREPLRFDGTLVVLNLAHQWAAPSLRLAALCAMAAAQRVAVAQGTPGHVIIDEAWALLADPAALHWLQGSWKLARARGVSHCVVLHRWSDVAAVGDVGSANRSRAQGLLRECETTWLFRQESDELVEMASALALSPREQAAVRSLRRGSVLVRYGPARSIVDLQPDARDRGFIDTDGAMRSRSSVGGGARPSLP